MLQFYEKEGFKLFPCNTDKSPKVSSWRATENHISANKADQIMLNSGYIGAWLPENYLVIDIDMNHKDKSGQPKPDGMKPFLSLCKEVGIQDDLLKNTLTVKTGSGGYHLYFKLPKDIKYSELSQKGLTESVDIRTHMGYVIACGTFGYSIHTDAPVAEIPSQLLNLIRSKNKDKAKEYRPTRELPISLLKSVLNRLSIESFASNDSWQEFITSVIATSGNSEEVINELEAWSKTDPNYAEDATVRKRLETFEPNGGITAGTFIHILKGEGISRHMVDRVRTAVGAEFSFSEAFADNYPTPFPVDMSLINEYRELMGAFYYTKHQTAGLTLFINMVKENLLYAENERKYYYFNGNYWVETPGVLHILQAVLLNAGHRFYSDVDKKNADSAENISEYINFLGSIAFQQRLESALKQSPEIMRSDMIWDPPENSRTLTIKDSVMDFSGKTIVFRKGKKEEYRRLFINLKESDFSDKKNPVKFKEFLKDVFPNEDTRKTATYVLSAMLSGTGRFRKFHIWNGSGNNGKTSLQEIMIGVIGAERAVTYTSDALLTTNMQSSLTPELAALRGSLVAFSAETNENKRVSEGAVKKMTGDESITANPKYKGMITFKTTFQLVLSTNFLPRFSAHDNAFINRLLILPFHTCFYDTDEKKENGKRYGSRYFKQAKNISVIKDEIMKERASILYYLAKRCQELELDIPESKECREAKEHYIKNNHNIMDMVYETMEFSEERKWFTPTADIAEYFNSEMNTKWATNTIVEKVKLVFPMIAPAMRRVNGKQTRGWKNVRFKYGIYPEGYMRNYTDAEVEKYTIEEQEEMEREQFKEATF